MRLQRNGDDGLAVLTVTEVAELLQVSEQTVRNELSSGSLGGRKVGKAWRVPTRALADYLRQDASAAPSERQAR